MNEKKIIITSTTKKENNKESLNVSVKTEGSITFIEAMQMLRMAETEVGRFNIPENKEGK